MPDTLAVIETQRVKDFLFGSRYLRETRGASLLLDRLNRRETAALVGSGAETVYLGGGSGRVRFDDLPSAEKFATEVRALYRRGAWDARVSVQVVEREAGESFADWARRGVRASQESKHALGEAVPVLAGRWIRPCSSCGREPAEHVPKVDVQGAHRLCASCRRKREEIKRFYQDEKVNWNERIPVPRAERLRAMSWPEFVLTDLVAAIETRPGAPRTLLPSDFDAIGGRSRPANYFAFLYADGNRMGEVVRRIGEQYPSPADDPKAIAAYRAFSTIVDLATRTAAVAAVLECVPLGETETDRGENALFVPAELLLAGGDDLILVVPADAGLAVAQRFLEHFQAVSHELQADWRKEGNLEAEFAPQGLTTSAGLVFSHDSYPASQLVDHAGELMKLAKRRAADLADQGRAEGTVDFAVLHESGSERLKERREDEYQGKLPSKLPFRRTERPYTAGELGALRRQIRALRESDVPRTKLKALYALLFRDPLVAQYEAYRVKERLQATGALRPGSALAELVESLNRFPFRETAGGAAWTTPLSELIELFDFERSGPQETTDG